MSSKRTNHKLAEQGRRNRINTALKEIEALLPPEFTQERAIKEGKETNGAGKTDGKDTKETKEKATPPTISKASTVEMAIDYIKALKKELEDTKEQLHAAESKLSGGLESSNGTATPTVDDNSSDHPTKTETSPSD